MDGSSGFRGDEGSRIATGVCSKRSVSVEVDDISNRFRIYFDVTKKNIGLFLADNIFI